MKLNIFKFSYAIFVTKNFIIYRNTMKFFSARKKILFKKKNVSGIHGVVTTIDTITDVETVFRFIPTCVTTIIYRNTMNFLY